MKKYITVAALLAAGTAFANAQSESTGTPVSEGAGALSIVTVDSDTFGWDTIESISSPSAYIFSGHSTSSAMVLGEGAILSGAAESPITNAVLYVAIPGVNSETFSDVSVSFDVTGSSTISYSAGFIDNSATTLIPTFLGGLGLTNPSTDKFTDTPQTLTFTLPASEFSSFVGTNTSPAPEGTALFAIAFNDSTWAGGTVQLSNINVLATSSIPEPSAFGLLAGIGALALVASRRRRK